METIYEDVDQNTGLRRRTIHKDALLLSSPLKPKPARFKPKKTRPEEIGRLLKTVGPPPIPKFASLGFYEYPFLIKVSSVGLFCSIIALTLPYWVFVWFDETSFYASFGLWNYCQDDNTHCTSIHDNIVPDKDVPVWFVLVQWSYLIGVAMTLVVFVILGHNYNGKDIRMVPTVYMAAECVSAIAAVQKFLALYTFTSYSNELDFLHYLGAELDYHGAFYCAVIGFCCDVIISVVLFLEEDVGPRVVVNNPLLKLSDEYEKVYRQGADMYLYNAKTAQMEYHLHEC